MGYYTAGQGTSVAVCSEVCTPAGPLLVYGTVITWLNDPGPAGRVMYGAEHSKAITDHAADWERLRRQHPIPMCVGGDFNSMLRRPVGNQAYGNDELRGELSVA